MATLREQVATLRRTAALSRLGRDGLLRVQGRAAFDVLDRLLPSELYIRSRRARQALLLDDAGLIEADLMLLADGDDYVVLSEGLDADALAARISDAARPGEDLRLIPLDDHAVIDLDGPYAWQVLGDVVGQGATALRLYGWYLAEEQARCLRAGQAGEYGYSLILPQALEASWLERLREAGQAVDLVEAEAAAIHHVRLEAWFFDVRRSPRACPLEWGLQWRVRWDKDFRGAEALRARRGQTRASVAFRAAQAVPVGAPVEAEGRVIGAVAACSDLTGEAIGAALVEPLYAQAGIDGYAAAGEPIRTVSAPFVRYRSLRGLMERGRYVREP